ncbi:hypothetical protein OFO11_33385, partial [Escherichia coli]|nr:hypothetical protein [Escherichia coli]
MKFVAKLSEVKALTKNRILNVPVNSIVFAPNCINIDDFDCDSGLSISSNVDEILSILNDITWDDGSLLETLLSHVQSLSKLKPKRKRS